MFGSHTSAVRVSFTHSHLGLIAAVANRVLKLMMMKYACHIDTYIAAYQQQNQNYYGNSLPPRGSGATGPVRAQAGHLVY